MKNISIKIKITLWYTIFMTLLVLLVLSLLISLSNNRIISSTKEQLMKTVTQNEENIEYDDGYLEFDDDFTSLAKGVYISVYDPEGNLLYGRIPPDFDNTQEFSKEKVRKYTGEQTIWYVYDHLTNINGYGDIWIRGITSQSQGDTAIVTIIKLSLILLPFFVLCATLGGYSITRKALFPLSKMTETARHITSGNDLTTRINLGRGKDEVHHLASTFDHMMDRLEDSFENEKRFTADVSHELRTPVSVILTQCEYSLKEDANEEERKEALTVILDQSKKMSNLISQLLTLARSDENQQKLHLESVNLSELAEIIVEEQSYRAAEKHITMETKIAPDIFMQADETMMMRLFINLISNSITYGKEGGETLVSLYSSGNKIIGSVSDNGIGISEENLSKIWKRFYQVDPSRTSAKESSAGLGLPMVKWIVQAHGGQIDVTSKLGYGTTFTFEFIVNKTL